MQLENQIALVNIGKKHAQTCFPKKTTEDSQILLIKKNKMKQKTSAGGSFSGI